MAKKLKQSYTIQYLISFLFICGIFIASQAISGVVIANCTGMVDFDIYKIDEDLLEQDVNIIGISKVKFEENFIILTGSYGEVKFDLKLGTLYRNGSDTGIYCTYSHEN